MTIFRHLVMLIGLCAGLSAYAGKYESIQWVDLLPEKDLKALLNDPIPDNVAEGTAADRINSALSMTIDDPVSRYEQALVSVAVKGEYNNKAIRLPGYIVPVDTTDDGKAVSFFFVPFFGACLHLPPPPPNQIIYATYEKGIDIDNLEDAYWIEATISTQQKSNDMATAAYSAVVDKLYPFKEGDKY